MTREKREDETRTNFGQNFRTDGRPCCAVHCVFRVKSLLLVCCYCCGFLMFNVVMWRGCIR